MKIPQIRTERLLMRGWRPSDRDFFAAMNADAEVMRHFPGLRSREESDEIADRIERIWREQRLFGWWALELPGEAPYIGYCGLKVPAFQAPFMPAVEIGWALARAFWGRGLASEAARASLGHAFRRLWLPEVVAFTAVGNAPSRALMERIGMRHDPSGDFDHPLLEQGHRLERHVLYRIRREEWLDLD